MAGAATGATAPRRRDHSSSAAAPRSGQSVALGCVPVAFPGHGLHGAYFEAPGHSRPRPLAPTSSPVNAYQLHPARPQRRALCWPRVPRRWCRECWPRPFHFPARWPRAWFHSSRSAQPHQAASFPPTPASYRYSSFSLPTTGHGCACRGPRGALHVPPGANRTATLPALPLAPSLGQTAIAVRPQAQAQRQAAVTSNQSVRTAEGTAARACPFRADPRARCHARSTR